MAKSKNEIQREYSQRTNYAAQTKYHREKTKHYAFAAMVNTESDIIEKLDSVSNKSGYIKKLIREDIAKQSE